MRHADDDSDLNCGFGGLGVSFEQFTTMARLEHLNLTHSNLQFAIFPNAHDADFSLSGSELLVDQAPRQSPRHLDISDGPAF